MPVIEAARLCDRAIGRPDPGQGDRRPPGGRTSGHAFKPVGALELKGLPEPLSAVEVAWEPLGEEAASLPAPAAPAGAAAGRLRRARGRARAPSSAVRGGQRGRAPPRARLRRARDRQDPPLDPRRPRGARPGRGGPLRALGRGPRASLRALGRGALPLRRARPRAGPARPRRAPRRRARPPRAGAHGSPPRRAGAARDRPRHRALPALGRGRGPSGGGLARAADRPGPGRSPLGRQADALAPKARRRARAEARALLIATYRESDLARGHPLSEVLADLHREQGVERIALKGLEEPRHRPDHGARRRPRARRDRPRARAASCSARPTATPSTPARSCATSSSRARSTTQDDGRWTVRGSLSELGLPQSVREVVGRRVERLGEEAQKALQVAAVIGREFDTDLLLRLTEHSEDELLDLLEEAAEASVLTESAKVPGRFSFAHALINHTLYADLGTTRRARLHRRSPKRSRSSVVPGPGSARLRARPPLGAGHAALDVSKAIAYARLAGERALSELAPDEALRWFTQALELLDEAGEGHAADRCELLIGLGEAQRQVGEADFRETLLEAAAIGTRAGRRRPADARRAGEHPRRSRQRWVASTMSASRCSRPPPHGSPGRRSPPRGRARAARHGAQLRRGHEPPRGARPGGAGARTSASRRRHAHAGDRPLPVRDLAPGDARGAPRAVRRAARARRSQNPLRRLLAYNRRIYYVLEAGDAEEADECVRRCARSPTGAQPFLRWVALYYAGMMAPSARAPRRGRRADRGRRGRRRTGTGARGALFYAASMLAAVRPGRVDEVIDLVEQSVEDNPGLPAWRGFHAVRRGRCSGEATRPSRCSPELGLRRLPHDFLHLAGLATGPTRVRCRSGSSSQATCTPRLAPFRDQVIGTVSAWSAP